MRVWFDKTDVNTNLFTTEQFLLIPFLKESVVRDNKDFSSCTTWISDISKSVEYTSIEECDVILYPRKLDINIFKYIKLAEQSNKTLICFYNDDNNKPSCLPQNVEIYRTSLFNSKRKSNEFGLPAWSCDFLDLVNLNIKKKREKPVVGFCGAITNVIRSEAINMLNNNQNILQDFKIRNSFWGGKIHDKNIRMEYVHHMNSSDLILCCSGEGNFSYRLYECMSLGRIPIIVDTDITLPCEDVIDWKNISIWVDKIDNINYTINNYWYNITDEKYYEHQRLIRKIYTDYLSPVGFAKYLSSKHTKL
jgi:hypothetical protein